MVNLDLLTALPALSAAVAARALQCYAPYRVVPAGTSQCLYAGPCAVGVCVPPATRLEWDALEAGNSLQALLDQRLAGCPGSQQEEWTTLQALHDSVVGQANTAARADGLLEFEQFVRELQAKYGVPADG